MIGMIGVEILNTTYEYGTLMNPMWLALFLAATLIIAILGICTINNDKAQKILKTLVAFTLTGVVICGIGLAIKTDEIIETKYKVTISEDVNFGEFMDKYEIISQEGKIYTIREKD